MKSKSKNLCDGVVKRNANPSVYDFTKVSQALALADDVPGSKAIDDSFCNLNMISDRVSGSSVKVTESTSKPVDSNINAAPMAESMFKPIVSNLYDFSKLQEALHDSENKIAFGLKVKRDVYFAKRARIKELHLFQFKEFVRVRSRWNNAMLMRQLVDNMVHCSIQKKEKER